MLIVVHPYSNNYILVTHRFDHNKILRKGALKQNQPNILFQLMLEERKRVLSSPAAGTGSVHRKKVGSPVIVTYFDITILIELICGNKLLTTILDCNYPLLILNNP